MRVDDTINTDDWITCEHCGMTYNPVMRHFCGEQAVRDISSMRAQSISLYQSVIAQMGGVIERLNTRIEALEQERDEARELVRMARSVAPALCDADQWLVWDAVKKALRRWDKEEPGSPEGKHR